MSFLAIFPSTFMNGSLRGQPGIDNVSSSSSSSGSSSSSSIGESPQQSNPSKIKHASLASSSDYKHTSPLAANLKVYISMTTIKSRLHGIPATIKTLLQGAAVLPDAIFVFVSKDPYLLDEGVTDIDITTHLESLVGLSQKHNTKIVIEYTENIGPHRKLLPLLRRVINDDDCVIVTVDDHETYKPAFLNSLLLGFEHSGQSAVVAVRARIIGVCRENAPNDGEEYSWNVSPYMSHGKGIWPEFKGSGEGGGGEVTSGGLLHAKLLLPTGNGGILYHPSFFRNKIVFDPNFITATKTADDIMFRLSTLSNGVPVVQTKLTMYPIIRRHARHHHNTSTSGSSSGSSSSLFEIVDGDRKYSFDSILNKSARTTSSSAKNREESSKTSNRATTTTTIGTTNTAATAARSARALSASEEWKNSEAKKISLATMFNVKGGNDAVIHSGIAFLKSKEVYDFDKELPGLIEKERPDCLHKFSLLDSMFGWSHITSHAVPFIMNLWNNQCAMTMCEFD